MPVVSTLENLLQSHGFDHFGFAKLGRPLSIDIYKTWLAQGLHADMNYLADHLELKENPQKLNSKVRSAIVIAKSYAPHPYADDSLRQLNTARYARGEDYHIHFKEELMRLAHEMSQNFPGQEFLCFTDSGPILERDLAHKAGLGWVGKNTLLIHPKRGSLFFLGEILTSLELTEQSPSVPDFCGTCDRCIRACPTGAIEEPRRLNANKCLAYWTIEARGLPPEDIRLKTADWFFGCDICQTVCPWNEKLHGKVTLGNTTPTDIEDLRWILTSSNKTLAKEFKSSPLSRARPFGLKRNAIIVAANLKIQELRPEIKACLTDPRLNEIARWALLQIA